MKFKIAFVLFVLSVLSACNKVDVKVTLPHNNCSVAACETTNNGSIVINGSEITR